MTWQIFNQTSGAWAGSCSIEPNHDDLAARNEIALEYTPGNAGTMLFDGEKVIELPAQPSIYHVLQDGEWVLDAEGETAQLAAARTAKYSAINTAAQAYINAAAELDKVPDFEVKTWERQAAEAEAWAADADAAAATPTLSAIAAARGLDVDELRKKALKKARAYSALTAAVAGQRQAYIDRLNAAATLAEITAINPVYGVAS